MSSLTLRVLGDTRAECPPEEFEFYEGEQKTLRLQIINNNDTEQKFCVPADGVCELVLSATPSDVSIANVDITVDTDDRSIISTLLTPAITDVLITGMLQLKITSVTKGIRIATLEYGLKKELTITE
jgi:ethanolamine utilization microcompartment shell protein EutS